MVSFLLHLSLCLALALTGANAASSQFVPASAASKALKIRGGTGPLDPETTVKALTVVAGAQGLAFWTGPKKSIEQYGYSPERSNDPMAQYLIEMFGCGITAYCVILYCLILQKTSLATAVQFCYIPWILQHLRSTLSAKDAPAAKGGKVVPRANVYDPSITAMLTAICALSIYVTGNQDYSDMSLKIQTIFWTLSGLQMILAPKAAGDMWKLDASRLASGTLNSLRNIGWYLVASWVFIGSMIFLDKAPLEGAAYGGLVWAAMHIINNLSGANKENGIDEGKIWIWALLNVMCSANILL